MSQADELLETLEEGTDEPAVDFTDDHATEPHIKIGNDRIIIVPEELKRLGVKNDHNIETVTFDCIRYWDGHDMSEMNIYIVYKTANGVAESYMVNEETGVTVDATDENIMHFDWVISKNVTKTPGPVGIQVCVRKFDEADVEQNHWNSEPNNDDCYISDGYDCDNEVVVDSNPDIIEELKRRMKNVEDKATQEWKDSIESSLKTISEKLNEEYLGLYTVEENGSPIESGGAYDGTVVTDEGEE